MGLRGDTLRDHILWVAKSVFLEMGFERASMDVVANRAATSKRTLYAHFESKEKLFLAVIELVRGLFLDRLKSPADYAGKPAEALVQFCARYLEVMLYEGTVQMCRVTMAETQRFPEAGVQYYDLLFTQVQARIAAYLKDTFGISSKAAAEAAQWLMAQILYPRFLRALYGVDPLISTFLSEETGSTGLDRQAFGGSVRLFRFFQLLAVLILPTRRTARTAQSARAAHTALGRLDRRFAFGCCGMRFGVRTGGACCAFGGGRFRDGVFI